MRDDELLAAEVNRLYWESDATVSEIVDELDVSRRALYDTIRPEDAGGLCPDCGAGLVFVNRSARDKAEATCPACGAGAEPGLEEDEAAGPWQATPAGQAPPEAEQERAAAALSPVRTHDAYERSRALTLGAAVMAGVAVGAAMVLVLGRD